MKIKYIKNFLTGNKNIETSYRIYDDIIEYKGFFGWKKFPYPEVYNDVSWSNSNLRLNNLFDNGAASLLRWKGQEALGNVIGYEFIVESYEKRNNRLKTLFRKKFPTPKDYMIWFSKNLKAGKEAAQKTIDTCNYYKEKEEKEWKEKRKAKLLKQEKEIF